MVKIIDDVNTHNHEDCMIENLNFDFNESNNIN